MRRRREREERDERERIEQEERDRERMEREREESPERGEKRVRTDTDTDVESTQSRQKKGQMKSIFLSDSDEEAIVEFVKQHEELYDKTNDSFKDKQKFYILLHTSFLTNNYQVLSCYVTDYFYIYCPHCMEEVCEH